MMESSRSTLYRSFLIVGMPLTALAGLVFDATAPIVLGLAGLLLVFVGWWLSRRGIEDVEVRRDFYPSAFEDDAVVVELAVENHAPRSAHLLELSDAFGPGMAYRQLLLEPGPLGPSRRVHLAYEGFCSRRWGVYQIGRAHV